MVRQPFVTALTLLLLFLALWTPRTLALNHFVTEDERRWLTRSANFYQAITERDWAHTFQREHPGVTVMWMGTLGFLHEFPAYARLAPGQFGWEQEEFETWLSANSTLTPLELLAAGRWWVALAIALILTAYYLPLRRLFGSAAAVLMTLFAGWSPFTLALSRQLHPDGLVSVLIFLALLLFLAWLYGGRQRRYLIASALVTGLAWLTKTPAIFLVPTGALLLLLEGWRMRRQGEVETGRQGEGHLSSSPLLPLSLSFVAWGFLAILTFVLLWPAMWLDPLGTLLKMASEMSEYVEGHVNPNYFLGQITADPGALFYPIAWFWRTTPATLIGLVLAAVAAWRGSPPLDTPTTRRSALALLLFALLFTLGMTLGAKKFDRYLLPAFPALDVLAALGWLGLGDWVIGLLGHQFRPNHPLSLSPALLVCFLLHALPGLLHYPYYLTYYNPLTGGSRTAPSVLFVGWGEGLDQAARWLNEQPDAKNLRVVSWYGNGPLSYFLSSREPVASFWSPDFWFDTDYAVVYVNQWQRRIPAPEAADFFANRTPAHTVTAGGLELARIYDLHGVTPPDFTGLYTASAADLTDQLRLAAYALGSHTFLSGDRFTIRLYWKRLTPMTPGSTVTIRLIAPNEAEVARSEHPLASDWSPNGILPDEHELTIPGDAASGDYRLMLGLPDGNNHLITSITVQAARRIETAVNWTAVQLTSLQHEPTMQPGQTLYVDLTTGGQTDGSLKLSARLVDSDGLTLAQTDKELRATTRFDLTLPPDAPPGTYTLVAVVYDPATLNPLPDGAGNFATTVSSVEVRGEE